MKLTCPPLTPGKIDQLQRTKTWLANLRESLLTKAAETQELQGRLSEAETSRADLRNNAALDPKAATQLAGVEQQILHLTPIVRQAERELAKDVSVSGAQIGTVRKDDLRELLSAPLLDQLLAKVQKQIAPLFRKEDVPAVAKNLASSTEIFRHAQFYLNRIAPRPSSAPIAAAWLAISVGEIDRLLAGADVVSVDHETAKVRVLDQDVADELGIDLSTLIADSEGNPRR